MVYNCSDDFFRFSYKVINNILHDIGITKIHQSKIDGLPIVKVDNNNFFKLKEYFQTKMVNTTETILDKDINCYQYVKIIDFSSGKWKIFYNIKTLRKEKIKKLYEK